MESALLSALRNSTLLFFDIDASGRYAGFNDLHRMEMLLLFDLKIQLGDDFFGLKTNSAFESNLHSGLKRALKGEACRVNFSFSGSEGLLGLDYHLVPHRDETDRPCVLVLGEAATHENTALAAQQKLLLLQSRQSQMAELLNMIAHQWRQPLTVISTLVGNIQLKSQLGGLNPDFLDAKLDKMVQTVQALSDTIESFRGFFSATAQKNREDLMPLLSQAVELLRPSLQRSQIQVELVPPEPPVEALIYKGEFLQVVVEILSDARDAFREETPHDQATRNIRVEWSQDQESTLVLVTNNAGFVPPAPGAGLGLSMARIIVEDHHGGRLDVQRRQKETEFRIQLPQGRPKHV